METIKQNKMKTEKQTLTFDDYGVMLNLLITQKNNFGLFPTQNLEVRNQIEDMMKRLKNTMIEVSKNEL
jgi:hypothetical protein